METRLPLCKKCKQFPIIDFLDCKNLSLECQCHDIIGMSAKEFENELLCEIKKDEYYSDEIMKICEDTPLEIELSNESSFKPKFELNETTINTQLESNAKKENNESLLKQNLKGFSKILNTDFKEIGEIDDAMSSETYNEFEFKENKKNPNYIYIKEEDLCKCIRHNKKEFLIYCIDCKFDLCNECLNMKSDLYSNTFIENKKHENHTKIPLEKIKDKFDEIDKLLKKIIKIEKSSKINSSNLTIIFKIIKCFMNNYEKYKCYNLYKSIENAKKFLEKINNDKSNLETFQIGYKKKLKINSEEELISLIHFSNEMSSINIQYKGKMNMSIFDKRDFGKLEELILIGNNIKDISSLSTKSFPQLKILNLEFNVLDSSIIPILKKLNLPELIELNLYKNNITDIRIFDLVKKFTKLKRFFIGENKLINDESNNYYEFPESIEEFGLTGIFEGENINFVKRLGIGNVKIFYISRNKITNLKSLKNIKFLRLGEFWAISNNITDIKEITNINNKENLWKINLKQNKIKNFNELFNIIEDFPNLKILNLTDNNGIGKKEVDEMKNKIKKKFNRDLDIVLND